MLKYGSPKKFDSPWRVGFFISGVQKGGTTALDSLLRRDPTILMAKRKEPHFFDDDGRDWEEPEYSAYHDMFDVAPVETRAIGEATPIYTYWPNCLERLKAYNPAAKIIVLLRHPAFRAHSHWKMEVARGAETLAFTTAIGDEGRDRVRSAQGSVHRVFSYVERGFYGRQVERLLELFARDQVLFLRTDELWLEPSVTVSRVKRFIGVHTPLFDVQRSYVAPVDSRELGPIDASNLAYLAALYAEDIRTTQRLTGLWLEDWQEPSYREPMAPSPT